MPEPLNPFDKIGLYSKAEVDVTKLRAQYQKANEDAEKQFSKLKKYNSPIQPAGPEST